MLAFTEDQHGFILDVGADPEMNQKAVLANRLILTASSQQGKNSFGAEGLSLTSHEGRPAFQESLPDALLRLQRREFSASRHRSPRPVMMNAVVRRRWQCAPASISRFDISGGGVGLMVSPEVAGYLQKGKVLSDCRIRCRMKSRRQARHAATDF